MEDHFLRPAVKHFLVLTLRFLEDFLNEESLLSYYKRNKTWTHELHTPIDTHTHYKFSPVHQNPPHLLNPPTFNATYPKPYPPHHSQSNRYLIAGNSELDVASSLISDGARDAGVELQMQDPNLVIPTSLSDKHLANVVSKRSKLSNPLNISVTE